MDKKINDFINYLFSLDFCCFEDEEDDDSNVKLYMYDMGEIKVSVDIEKSTFDVYFDFPYYDIEKRHYEEIASISEIDDDIESNLFSDINKYWAKKELEIVFFKEPNEEIESYCMCPGSNVFLGYFNCDIEKRANIIEIFLSVDNSKTCDMNIDAAVGSVVNDYLLSKGYSFDENAESYISKNKQHVFSISNLVDSSQMDNVEMSYMGKEYTLMKTKNGHFCSLSNNNMNDFNDLTDILGWFRDPDFYYDSKSNILFATNGLVHLSLKTINRFESDQNLEYMYLMASFDGISEFRPKAELNLCEFSHLTATEFESLCNELLVKKNFVNIHPIGSTNTPDGGRDLIAEEIINSNIGTEKRVYIIQCKHSKIALKRDAIGEIDTLLRENNAEKYLLLCSNDINPQTIDRLERQNDRRINKVAYWGRVELSVELQQHHDLIDRYKLLGKFTLPKRL